MGGHGNGLYFDIWTICRSPACGFSLLVCDEADVSTQEGRNKKDTGTKVNGESNEVEGKADEIRGD